MERTYIMVKPDGVQRNVIGEIISRFEKKGFTLVAAKLMVITEAMAQRHYEEHTGKPFFEKLVRFITSGPVFAMVWEGPEVIKTARLMIGKTNPQEALPGTIRGDLAAQMPNNIIHGSDSTESAEREIAIFFQDSELIDYKKATADWT
ncbi:nucleoside-diphosphate kinase [Halalkalibacter sp. APA_J-10(15)]|uniref:nucleoside-diphosphate kinase n=1 Tax=unclassified Halalkalibacter TaxID=2893063 RepID=UPI001FF56CB7|nr:nucleoside-diphosphate kinase [Halalkalibacter sp. APA_J-10(15)]MCK0472122.1 nucleoside-diphosphate kinase [Halalkalibacter sp. APA_J-10(15)]